MRHRPTGSAEPLPVRRITFSYPSELNAAWSRRLPELAAAANSVSLLMPYAEPYFVRSVRVVLQDLDEPLRSEAEAYARQEIGHHVQHRRFNDLLVAQVPALARLERLMERVYGGLGRRASTRYNLAFAAGSETIAYSLARWTEAHLDALFDDADPVPATLLLWHLAEEIEHKSAAFDIHRALDGSRWRYAHAAALSLALLAAFTVAATIIMLVRWRRLHAPVAWWRLTRWAVSFGFVVLPTLAVSLRRDHHPSQLADPVFLPAWLRLYDPATRSMPLYDRLGANAERSVGPGRMHEPGPTLG
jgi:uncharacterized protein